MHEPGRRGAPAPAFMSATLGWNPPVDTCLRESVAPAPGRGGPLPWSNAYVRAVAIAGGSGVPRPTAAGRAAFGTRSSRMPLAMTISTESW